MLASSLVNLLTRQRLLAPTGGHTLLRCSRILIADADGLNVCGELETFVQTNDGHVVAVARWIVRGMHIDRLGTHKLEGQWLVGAAQLPFTGLDAHIVNGHAEGSRRMERGGVSCCSDLIPYTALTLAHS